MFGFAVARLKDELRVLSTKTFAHNALASLKKFKLSSLYYELNENLYCIL